MPRRKVVACACRIVRMCVPGCADVRILHLVWWSMSHSFLSMMQHALDHFASVPQPSIARGCGKWLFSRNILYQKS